MAAIIEVKSKLNKDQLIDAANKIASVKKIKSSPISNIDEPVTFSRFIISNTFGCVFAYDSYTSLDTLAENLKEINEQHDSMHWIDLVVVLDKGIISYAVQMPFSSDFPGWYQGAATETFPVFPIYIHLTKQECKELSLNHFFIKLMSQLTFFRRRTSLDFQGILGSDPTEMMTIQGYQYNSKRKLVQVEKAHQEGSFQNPKIRFNLYDKNSRILVGQTCLWPWQDGSIITCSARFDPRIIFDHYFRIFKQKGVYLRAGIENSMFFSSLLIVTDQEFIDASKEIHKDLISIRDSQDDKPPPVKI